MSLFHREKQQVLAMVVFGGLAVLIIIATAYLVVKAVRHMPVVPGEQLSGEQAAVFAATPAEVINQYEKDLKALQDALKKYSGSREEFFAFVENALITMRVPKEMLDPHIAAVLKVRSLHTSDPQGDERVAAEQEVKTLLTVNESAYE